MTACFVIPATETFVSGGNIYNNALTGALAKTIAIERMDWETFMLHQNACKRYIFDSLYLDLFEKENIEIPQTSILLLHYLDVFYEQKNNQSLHTKRINQLGKFEQIIVTGNYSKDWLTAHDIAAEKIIVAEPAVCIRQEKKHLLFDRTNILMIGNLVEVKGYKDFLNELTIQQPANLSVTILGDSTINPDCSQSIKQQIQQSGYLTRTIHLQGTVPHSEVTEYFEQNNLFVSASLFETFGMAVHEALQFGLPVYALANGNLTTIQHPLLSLFNNNRDLINAIKSFNPATVFAPIQQAENNYTWQDAARKLIPFLAD